MDNTSTTLTQWNSGQMMPGLARLKTRSTGHSAIRVAVLDTAIDANHLLLRHQQLPESAAPAEHGTHIASIIAGRCDMPPNRYVGIAPDIHLLPIQVYPRSAQGTLQSCSQAMLADAIHQACDSGAHIINISGGDVSRFATCPGALSDAVQRAVTENRLVVAATGNNGNDSIHTPACLPHVLAVGAADWNSCPSSFSNFGARYHENAVLAPGEDIPGAGMDDVICLHSGTSFAAPIVTGISALLLSLQIEAGIQPDPQALRDLILKTATAAQEQEKLDPKRVLVGRLNVEKLTQAFDARYQLAAQQTRHSPSLNNCKDTTMNDSNASQPYTPAHPVNPAQVSDPTAQLSDQMVPASLLSQPVLPQVAVQPQIRPASIDATVAKKLVYCLGSMGFDFQIEARMDYFIQRIAEYHDGPLDLRMFRYIVENDEWDNAELLTWVLKIDGTPTYAINPVGSGKSDLYKTLIACLYYQLPQDLRPDIEREFYTNQQQNILFKHGMDFSSDSARVNPKLIRGKDELDYHVYMEEEIKLHKLGEYKKLTVDQVAIAGEITGEVKLYNGSTVPLINVAISGISPWNKSNLIEQQVMTATSGTQFTDYLNQLSTSDSTARKLESLSDNIRESVERALEKVYHEFKNNGVSEDDRAINYVGTNILTLVDIFSDVFEVVEENSKFHTRYEFDTAVVETSKVQRPTSILKDVVLRFFEPSNLDKAYKCYRFTIDVSDINPVMVEGKPKVFFESNKR